jgi:hypothetical protein
LCAHEVGGLGPHQWTKIGFRIERVAESVLLRQLDEAL